MRKDLTEEQVLEAIDKVVGRLAYKFKFGYHDIEDMKQQATQEALKCLDQWDGVRPLENFMWTHVHNRLYNFKRDNYARLNKPCDTCPFWQNKQCTKYDNQLDCDLYDGWVRRNEAKKALMSTVEHQDITPHESDINDQVFGKSIFYLLNSKIPPYAREDWIRFTNNLKLPKTRRLALIELMKEIVQEEGISIDE